MSRDMNPTRRPFTVISSVAMQSPCPVASGFIASGGRKYRLFLISSSSCPSSAPPLEVLKPREFLQERELYRARRPVPLLADDDLGDTAVLVRGFVFIFAEYEHHYVCVLFNGARVMTNYRIC